jgi:tight adherence protein B
MALALVTAGIGFVFAYTRIERQERRRFSDRITKMIGTAPRSTPTIESEGNARRAAVMAALRLPFSFGLARTWGVKLSTPVLYLVAAAGGVAVWLLLHGLIHLPSWAAGALAVAAFFLGPRFALARQQRRAEEKFVDHFPDTVDMIIRMMRAGLPVAAAIRAVGQQAQPPVNDVFVHIANQTDIGMALEDSLTGMAEEIGLADFRFFAVAVGLQRATGGNLARTLEIFGDIVRKRRAVRLKAGAATAEVRMSAIVLAAIPLLVVAGMAVLNPGYLKPLIVDPRGHAMVGMAIGSMTLGGLVMRWLIRAGTKV